MAKSISYKFNKGDFVIVEIKLKSTNRSFRNYSYIKGVVIQQTSCKRVSVNINGITKSFSVDNVELANI